MSDTRAAGPHLLDRLVQRLLGHPQQRRRFLRHLADRQRDRAVAVVAVERRADVDRDDVALLQHPPARRDAVDDLFVDRRANRRRIPVIALERRRRARRRAIRFSASSSSSAVLTPGATFARQRRQHLADQASGLAHPLELGRRSADNHRTAPRRRPRRARRPLGQIRRHPSGACAPLTARNVGRAR